MGPAGYRCVRPGFRDKLIVRVAEGALVRAVCLTVCPRRRHPEVRDREEEQSLRGVKLSPAWAV